MSLKARALIADDEAALSDYLQRLLHNCWPELEIVQTCANGEQALGAIEQYRPEIAFLDVQMPALNGLQVAQRLQHRPHLVFVTAYDQYAIPAFEQAAVDYLLKPVSEARLRETVKRLQQRLSQPAADLSQLLAQLSTPARIEYLNWLKASQGDEVRLIAVNEVDYFEAADKYTSVHCGSREWIIRTPLKQLESQLNPEHFWRIHRSLIVRVAAIEKFSKTFSGQHEVKLGGHKKPLPVSRSYVHLFKQD